MQSRTIPQISLIAEPYTSSSFDMESAFACALLVQDSDGKCTPLFSHNAVEIVYLPA
jgi:hypothetical protein